MDGSDLLVGGYFDLGSWSQYSRTFLRVDNWLSMFVTCFLSAEHMLTALLDACHYLRLIEPSENILGKVESKLNFLFRRVPFYVSLENRIEMSHMELLPTANSSRTQSTSRATTPIPMESGSGFAAAGPGRVLGS